MSATTRPARVGGLVLAATLLLGGCAGLRPGTAVQVGEEQITTAEIDSVATDFCAALEGPLDQQAQSIPHGYFRGGIAGILALREVASQMAAKHGVEPDSEEYRQQLADLRNQVAELPEAQQEAVLTVESSPIYVRAVQIAVGEKLLGGDAEAGEHEAAGAEEMQRWIDENGVEFDPSLNTTIEDGQVATADGALSFAVSEGAKAGQEEQPNSALAAELPDSQRCGR